MNSTPKSEEFYANLKIQLTETATWPSLYLYKFILLQDDDNSKELLQIFDNLGAVISSKKSKKGKYLSYSIKVKLDNPDAVIAKYKEVSKKLPKIISL